MFLAFKSFFFSRNFLSFRKFLIGISCWVEYCLSLASDVKIFIAFINDLMIVRYADRENLAIFPVEKKFLLSDFNFQFCLFRRKNVKFRIPQFSSQIESPFRISFKIALDKMCQIANPFTSSSSRSTYWNKNGIPVIIFNSFHSILSVAFSRFSCFDSELRFQEYDDAES